jgi:hypothetical protein
MRSIRIADLWAEIWTVDLWSSEQEYHPVGVTSVQDAHCYYQLNDWQWTGIWTWECVACSLATVLLHCPGCSSPIVPAQNDRWINVDDLWSNNIQSETEIIEGKTCPSATLCIKPTWSALGSNSCLCGDWHLDLWHGLCNNCWLYRDVVIMWCYCY